MDTHIEEYRGYQITEDHDKYGSRGFNVYRPAGNPLGLFQTVDEAQKEIDKNIESIRDSRAQALIRFCELPIENQVTEYLKALSDSSTSIGSSITLFQVGLHINSLLDWELELKYQREKKLEEGTKT